MAQPRVSNHINTTANIPGAVMNAVLLSGSLNIVHGNAQSLCARRFNKFEEVKLALQSSKIGIACFMETWLTERKSDNCVSVPGYSMIRNDRSYRRGGGIIVYFRSYLHCTKLFATELTCDAEDKTECLALDVKVNNGKILLLVIYNPPENDYSRFIADKLCMFSDSYENVVLIGDLNTDLLRSSRWQENLTSVFQSFSMTSTGEEPIFFHDSGCSQLDLLVTNDCSKILRFSQVGFSGLSQHDLIFASLDSVVTREEQKITFRDYVNFDAQAVANAVLSVPWNEFYVLTEVNQLASFFTHQMKTIHDEYIPLREAKANKRSNPWFNADVRRSILERELAYKEWQQSPSYLKHTKHQHFKTLRNRTNLLIRRAKEAYFERFLGDYGNIGNLWKRVKSLGVCRKVSSAECNFDPDEVNNTFLSNCTPVQHLYQQATVGASPAEAFRFKHIETWEVINAVWDSTSNAVGSDGIPIKFIKILLPLVVEQICFLFNRVIETATYPDVWKQITVLPLRKKSHLNSLTNLRPISILCALSKVFEKLIGQQISSFLFNNFLPRL
ncbi:uncharacterized protein LOC128739260 [Sabethes cyaneus]|uniref:uncharacterized protein LOC128739260 n=1 Tax=Sabethes cyaneus TaxID=53552 RepID=UPI00237D36EA|nr:uncharacterized protein LOC128739260 [Sabethes cyaneus]